MRKFIYAIFGLIVLLSVVFAGKVFATQQDSIAIDRQDLSCGEQSVVFSGSATYDLSSEYIRKVYVFNEGWELIYYSEEEPANWVTDSVDLGVGVHAIYAALYDPNPEDGHIVAEDYWEFEVEECLGTRPLCHVPSGNPENAQTIYPNQSGYNGHFGNEGGLHGEDYFGECVVPTPTPTEEVTPTPTPTPTEEPKEVCEDEEAINFGEEGDCEYEEVTPTPTPTPTEEPQEPVNEPGPTLLGGGFICPNGEPAVLPANAHVVRNGSSATVNAHIPEGDNVNIYYRENSASDWQHAARDIPVTGQYLSYTINDLDPTLGYTFGIQAENGCAGGEVVAVVVDPPANGRVFMLSYFELLN